MIEISNKISNVLKKNNRAFNGALALAKAKHKKAYGGVCHVINSHLL